MVLAMRHGVLFYEATRVPLLPFSGVDKATEIEDLGVVSVLEGISLSLLAGEIFENGMGIRFVPVPIAGGDSNRKVLFSIWETRVSDYALFIEGAGRDWPE
jgi:hypothetical protein